MTVFTGVAAALVTILEGLTDVDLGATATLAGRWTRPANRRMA